MSSTRLTIDLDALAHNFHALAREAAGAEVAPVLKADGYGLGAAEVGRRLAVEGARRFFVARLDEGEALRRALGPGPVIHVLDGLAAGSARRLAEAGLSPVVHSLPQVEAAAAALAGGLGLSVGLQVDTGMNRLGLDPAEAQAIAQRREPGRALAFDLVMSHLGSAHDPADPRNAEQLARFRRARAMFPEAKASLSASAGVFLGPDYRFDIVRPGVSLFGGGPRERPDPRIAAVVRLEAPVIDIRRVAAGELIGYGARARAERPMRLAILAAGYADGVIRAARGQGRAVVDGRSFPFVSVTMDLIAVDIGEARLSVGDMAELLGPDVLLDDLAAAAGTVAHEVLVRLSTRAERRYAAAPARLSARRG